jgi:glycosyltransferase involved in cell wall biosynthesis
MHDRRVVIIQRVIPDYRESFFRQLNEELTKQGMELILLEGKVQPAECLISAGKHLSFAKPCKTFYLPFDIYWMRGITSICWSARIVIMEQASSGLHLYWCFFLRFIHKILARKKQKIILWGHGITLSERRFLLPLRRLWKKMLTKLADYVFAYTEISAKAFMEMGIPSDKIKIIRNTHDTNQIKNTRSALSNTELQSLKKKLFKQDGDINSIRIGIFCGRLRREKWIPFLLEAITLVHQKIPNFRMIIIGDGEHASIVQDFCSRQKWCIWTGAIYGHERVKYMSLADVWLHPGATGLAIVDSFAMGIPFITTKNELHGPEIAYLKHFHNGIISPPDAKQYAETVVYLLNNPSLLSALKWNALTTADTLTISQMVQNFCEGISIALGDD